MNYIKTDILSANSFVKHGFVYLEGYMNINEISDSLGLKKIKTVKQVHSNKFVYLNDVNKFKTNFEADAIISDLSGYGVGVYTADCVPIIFIDTVKKKWGVIHAGWKGTLAGITEKVSDYLLGELGCKSENIKVAIGPCIEGSCYEIGEEVAVRFKSGFDNPDLFLKKEEGKKYSLDLKTANTLQLRNKGITEIELVDICTKCDLNYPSFRRDGKNAGRMLSFVGFV